jgi:hypothetical protein
MKWATLALAGFFLLPAQDDDREKRIAQAMRWFGDRDPEVRESARAELLAFGREAVPAVERALTDRSALDLAKLFRDLSATPAPSPSGEPYVLPEDDPSVPKLDKEVADRFVRAKYAEAIAYARKNQYQRGLDMANGLLALEPHSSIADRVKQVRRYCENMITQTSLIEAKVLQERLAYVSGEPVALTLRLKNIYRNSMTIKYEGAEGKSPEGLAVVETEATVSSLKGESTTANRHQEISLEGDIPLATGAQWERKLQLDTVFGLPDDLEVQTVVVNVWTVPSKIDSEGVNLTRKLQFEPAVVKLVPKRYAHFLEKPLEWLQKTIEGEQPAQETWICAQLLPPEDRRRGAEILVHALEKTDNPKYVPALVRMLTEVTGERLGEDPKKWSEWLTKERQEKKKKK